MKCPKCGSENGAQAAFCQKCGANLASGGVAGGPLASAAADPAAALLGRRRGIPDVPEEVLWEGGYSPKAMFGGWIAGGLVSLLLLAAAAFLRGRTEYWWAPLAAIALVWFYLLAQLLSLRLSVHYKLTNQRLFNQRGILSRKVNRVEVIDIDDVAYEQGILERMFNVGRIKVMSSDRTDPVLWLVGIENVQDVFTLIDKARRAERMRRGVAIDAV